MCICKDVYLYNVHVGPEILNIQTILITLKHTFNCIITRYFTFAARFIIFYYRNVL